jgi:beta-lactamase class A
MRDRRKPFDKKRSSRQSDRQSDNASSRRASRGNPRDRKKGGFFGLLGGSSKNSNRRQRGKVQDSSAAKVAVNRLVDITQDLQPPRPTNSTKSPTVIPLPKRGSAGRDDLRAGRNRRREALRQNQSERSKALISLPSPRSKSGKFMLYGARLLIFGVGVGVLAGTMMSVWDPASYLSAGASSQQAPIVVESKSTHDLQLGQEMTQLKTQLTTLAAQNKQIKPGVLLLDLDTNAYVDINASETFPAASTIKFPILVAFFQEVDAGKIQLNEPLTMKKEQIATEAGDMQYQPVGTQFSAIETATNMMVVSDNTATNMLIEKLGGMAALTSRFQSWGMKTTSVRNLLPDVQGQNQTSPKDLANLMNQVQGGKLISMKSRDRILDIMKRVENDSMLPQGLGTGAAIAHKTGTLGILLGDIGLIDTPNGKRYLASVLVQRPRNDAKAEELIQQISKLTYQAFTQPQSAQSFDRPRIAQPVN